MTGPRRGRARATLAMDLEAVTTARFSELRDLWRDRLGDEPPTLGSREIFRRMLAYRLQAAAHGDLSAAVRRKLADMEARRTAPSKAATPAIRLRAGAKLIRDWKGIPHEVWVTDAGFVHQGQTYKSLSEVARAITGTRWNGPLFFGLRDKMKEAA